MGSSSRSTPTPNSRFAPTPNSTQEVADLVPCVRCHQWIRAQPLLGDMPLCNACAQRTEASYAPVHPDAHREVDTATIHASCAPWQSWCAAHSPWPRVPVFLLIVYWAVRSIFDAQYSSVFDAINLGIHEIGHVVFTGGGELLHFLGGTLLQLAAPLAGGVVLWRQRDWFGLAFAAAWFGTSLHGVAIYMADARARILPLVSLGNGEPQHDWEYLFGRFGLLQQDLFFAGCVRALAIVTFLAAVSWGGWILWNLFRTPERRI